MDDAGLLAFLRWPAAPLWAIFLVVSVTAFKGWPAIMARLTEAKRTRATIEGEQFERMDGRLKRLEEREEECQRALTDALRRIAQLEGYDAGQGQVRQEVTRIQAATRIAERRHEQDGEP